MKRFIIVVSALSMIFALAGLVSAEPTVMGPTGLIATPTADIATPESAWLGASYIDFSDGNIDDTIWSYTLTGGLMEQLEMGVSGFFHSDADDGFALHGKYAIFLEGDDMPGVSVGLFYMDLGGETFTQLYLVGSRYFQADDNATERAVGIHGGIAWVDSDWVTDEFNYWGAVDFNIAENLIAIAEYMSTYGPNDTDAFSFGVRYFANEQWSAQAGMIDGDLTIGTSFIF